jgi:hypothetical protein
MGSEMGRIQFSPSFSLARKDLIAVGKGALIVGAGALLDQLTPGIADTIDRHVPEALRPVTAGAWMILVNLARKYVTPTEYI